jgi:hypothetical protein
MFDAVLPGKPDGPIRQVPVRVGSLCDDDAAADLLGVVTRVVGRFGMVDVDDDAPVRPDCKRARFGPPRADLLLDGGQNV